MRRYNTHSHTETPAAVVSSILPLLSYHERLEKKEKSTSTHARIEETTYNPTLFVHAAHDDLSSRRPSIAYVWPPCFFGENLRNIHICSMADLPHQQQTSYISLLLVSLFPSFIDATVSIENQENEREKEFLKTA